MACPGGIEWDGRTWRAGQRVFVDASAARRCPGFAGVLVGLEPQPVPGARGPYAIVWIDGGRGRFSTSVEPGELQLET